VKCVEENDVKCVEENDVKCVEENGRKKGSCLLAIAMPWLCEYAPAKANERGERWEGEAVGIRTTGRRTHESARKQRRHGVQFGKRKPSCLCRLAPKRGFRGRGKWRQEGKWREKLGGR
jgi:hypothetical protein